MKAVRFRVQNFRNIDDSGPSQIKTAAESQKIDLPKGWKAPVARHLVSSWAENDTTLAAEILDTAASLFSEIEARFENMGSEN